MAVHVYHTGALKDYVAAGAPAIRKGTLWERGKHNSGRVVLDERKEQPDSSQLPHSDLDGDLIDSNRIPPDLLEE